MKLTRCDALLSLLILTQQLLCPLGAALLGAASSREDPSSTCANEQFNEGDRTVLKIAAGTTSAVDMAPEVLAESTHRQGSLMQVAAEMLTWRLPAGRGEEKEGAEPQQRPPPPTTGAHRRVSAISASSTMNDPSLIESPDLRRAHENAPPHDSAKALPREESATDSELPGIAKPTSQMTAAASSAAVPVTPPKPDVFARSALTAYGVSLAEVMPSTRVGSGSSDETVPPRVDQQKPSVSIFTQLASRGGVTSLLLIFIALVFLVVFILFALPRFSDERDFRRDPGFRRDMSKSSPQAFPRSPPPSLHHKRVDNIGHHNVGHGVNNMSSGEPNANYSRPPMNNGPPMRGGFGAAEDPPPRPTQPPGGFSAADDNRQRVSSGLMSPLPGLLAPQPMTRHLCAGLLVPSGNECVLAVPTLATAGVPRQGSIALNVRDLNGKPVIQVDVQAPSWSGFGQPPIAVLRAASVVGSDGHLGGGSHAPLLAYCKAYREGEGAKSVYIYDGRDEVFAHIAKDPFRNCYVLTSGCVGLQLVIDGDFRHHTMSIVNEEQEELADTELIDINFGTSHSYYKLRVSSNVDVGLMLCGLLAIDAMEMDHVGSSSF